MSGEYADQVRQWPTDDLTRGQRELHASLALCPPSSPMRVPIMEYLHAIKAELDNRDTAQPHSS